MESLVAVEKEIDKALDLFATFYDQVDDDVDQAIACAMHSINDLMNSSENDFKNNSVNSIQAIKEHIKGVLKRYSDKHKDLHGTISKIGKVIDKNFISDFGNLPQVDLLDTHEKKQLLNEVIYEHFLRCGHIDVADLLNEEACLNTNDNKKQPFIQMNYIVGRIREKDLQPALNWCYENHDKLNAINSTLEFNLHRLNFIKLIVQGSKRHREVLQYARNFTPFANTSKKEIQRLMGSLIYINDGLENSPYSSFLDPSAWEEIEEEFIKNVCKLMGLSVECPLTVCINTGCKALPALINIVQVMQQTQVNILSKDELPIEIDIDPNHRYHSVFTCPILRQQSTDINPPMRLVCGHVISRDALNKLNSAGKLKCPYCPVEQAPSDAKQIFF